ncbi:hypothetical protein OS493_027651 [Desmophyllum pertusum]|uniref:Uncharacterized protein n=1 Tax=Desmophyllum pertusum TaxID=174260 RepID=A0A9X0D1A5_9CNID|nr:hypothetical protein OS493_027651 [Desmophyllum pertusum]
MAELDDDIIHLEESENKTMMKLKEAYSTKKDLRPPGQLGSKVLMLGQFRQEITNVTIYICRQEIISVTIYICRQEIISVTIYICRQEIISVTIYICRQDIISVANYIYRQEIISVTIYICKYRQLHLQTRNHQLLPAQVCIYQLYRLPRWKMILKITKMVLQLSAEIAKF